MKSLTASLALIMMLWVPQFSYADLSATVALGLGAYSHQSPFERLGAIGYSFDLGDKFYIKPEVGAWLKEGQPVTYFAALPVSARVLTASGIYVHLGIGPAYVTPVDGRVLSTHFEFCPELGVGFKANRIMIGGVYRHFSNGGIRLPNRGVDFAGINMELDL